MGISRKSQRVFVPSLGRQVTMAGIDYLGRALARLPLGEPKQATPAGLRRQAAGSAGYQADTLDVELANRT